MKTVPTKMLLKRPLKINDALTDMITDVINVIHLPLSILTQIYYEKCELGLTTL